MDLLAQFEAIVDALTRARVEFAVCGGLAVNVHGHVRATMDVDLLLPSAQVDAALSALKPLGYEFDGGVLPFDTGTEREREIRRVTRIEGDDALTVDLLYAPSAFDEVWRTRVSLPWRGRSLPVVSLEGLAVMKRIAGRLQDLADLERLGVEVDRER
ncbi:MAG: hypothetical protein R3A52_17865 [Polyangiales bacterium]